MSILSMVILIAALASCGYAAFKTPEPSRYGWLGLTLWMLNALITSYK